MTQEERSVSFFPPEVFIFVVVIIAFRVIRECMLSSATFWNFLNYLCPKTFLFFINNQGMFKSRQCSVPFSRYRAWYILLDVS